MPQNGISGYVVAACGMLSMLCISMSSDRQKIPRENLHVLGQMPSVINHIILGNHRERLAHVLDQDRPTAWSILLDAAMSDIERTLSSGNRGFGLVHYYYF